MPPDAPVLAITDDMQLAYADTTAAVAYQIRTRVVLRTGVIAGWLAGIRTLMRAFRKLGS